MTSQFGTLVGCGVFAVISSDSGRFLLTECASTATIEMRHDPSSVTIAFVSVSDHDSGTNPDAYHRLSSNLTVPDSASPGGIL